MLDIYIEFCHKHSLLKEDQRMSDHLDQFFAVTESGSLYRVYANDEDKIPGLEKLALVGESAIPAGRTMKGDVSDRIGIMHDVGLAIYFPLSKPHNPPRPNLVSVAWQETPHTSKIVALFLDGKSARQYLEKKFGNRAALLQLWKSLKTGPPEEATLKKLMRSLDGIKSTLKTLRAIGDDHPRFILDSAFARWIK
jgi:hypothetical protein